MKKYLTIYMIILKIFVFFFLIKNFINNNYYICLLYLISLIFFLISYLFKHKFKLEYIYFFENITYLMIFAYEFNLLYKNIPFWDTGMHALTGYFLVILVLISFNYLKKIKRIKVYPFFMTLFAFCFSLSIGFMWELIEYTQDRLNKDMQKDMIVNSISTTKFSNNEHDLIKIFNIKETIIYYLKDNQIYEFKINDGYLDLGINDTMKDLYVNFMGSILSSIYMYLNLKVFKNKNNYDIF